jgi:hypothetical protein
MIKNYAGCSLATGKVSMPNRSKMITQIKRDTLALWVGVKQGVNDPSS